MSKKYRTIIIAILAVFILAVVGYATKGVADRKFSTSNPQYVVSHAIDAYKHHDINTFEKYVDIDAVGNELSANYKDYKKNSKNRIFTPINNANPNFSKVIDGVVNGTEKLDNTSTNVGINCILSNIDSYDITNEKDKDGDKSFDLVAKVKGNEVVIPMTMKKSGDNWQINSVDGKKLFIAYDNEVKRQAAEFQKVMGKSYSDIRKDVSGNNGVGVVKIDMGTFITFTNHELYTSVHQKENKLNDQIEMYNTNIKLLQSAKDTNEVGKIYKASALVFLKYGVTKFTVELNDLEKINNLIYDDTKPTSNVVDSYMMDAGEKIEKDVKAIPNVNAANNSYRIIRDMQTLVQ